MALTVLASLICVLPALAALICVLSTLAALICILAALVWVLSHRLRRSVCLLILSLVHSLTLVHALALVHALILIHPLALIHALALIHSLALIQPLALVHALVLIHPLALVFRIGLLSIYGSALLSCVLRLSLFTLIAVFTCCFFRSGSLIVKFVVIGSSLCSSGVVRPRSLFSFSLYIKTIPFPVSFVFF